MSVDPGPGGGSSGSTGYYGYTTGTNKTYRQLVFMGRHMGEDLTHYTRPDTSRYYANYKPTYKPSNGPAWQWADAGGTSHDGIEKIYPRVMAQNAPAVWGIVSHWQAVYQGLSDMATTIRAQTDALAPKWQSAGADVFRSRGPGATLKSLADWTDAALVNIGGLSYLAGQIEARQSEMQTLWDQYLKATADFTSSILTQADVSSVAELKALGKYARINDLYVNGLKTIENMYAQKAQQIEAAMAADYADVAGPKLAGGSAGIFEGPNNAVLDAPGHPPLPAVTPPGAPGLPGLPGAPLGVAPRAPGAAPAPRSAPAPPGAAPGAPPTAPGPPAPGPTAPGPAAPGPAAPGTLPAAPGAGPVGTPNAPGGAPAPPGALPGVAPAPPGALPAAAALPGAAPAAPGVLPAALVPAAGVAPAVPPAALARPGPGSVVAGDQLLPSRPATGIGPGGVLGANPGGVPAAPGAPTGAGGVPAAPPGLTRTAPPGQRLPARPAAVGGNQRGGPGEPGVSGRGGGRPGPRATPGSRGLPPPPGGTSSRPPASPQSAGRRKPGTGEPSAPAVPTSFDELPLGPTGAAPPVLDGRPGDTALPHLPGTPAHGPVGARGAGARLSGTTPPVLGGRSRPAGDTGRPDRPASGAGFPGGLDGSDFALAAPAARPTVEAPVVPSGGIAAPPPRFPGARPAGGAMRGAPSQDGLAAPAARKRKRKDAKRPQVAGPASDEAAWTVETPGGAVLDAAPEAAPPAAPAAAAPTAPRRVAGAG